jgi:hypothetical protein
MKSTWLWIIGVVIAIWLFSGEKKNNTSDLATSSPLPKPNYQPQPINQQPTIQPYSSTTFMGYQCTVDCSGHEAGYEWAEENSIDDPYDCGGNSESFIEGCQAYAEEQQAAMEENIDDDQ